MGSKQTRKPFRLSPSTRSRIRKEAAALALSEEDYMTLVSQLAEAIRGSILPEGTKDASTLRTLLDNPLLLSLAAAMAGTVWSTVKERLDQPEQELAPSVVEPLPGRTGPQYRPQGTYQAPPYAGHPYYPPQPQPYTQYNNQYRQPYRQPNQQPNSPQRPAPFPFY